MEIGILISGRGSNMVAIVDAVRSGEIPDSEVAVVISDMANAAGLEKARERAIETVVVERRGRTRDEHDAEIIAELQKRGVELVCLAGYMRLLSKDFIRAFENKIVNIHPSLLPAYPGLNVHQRVLAAGEKTSGCTVHYVNEDLDAGPVILQRAVEVRDSDTPESLSARILEQEHTAYVEALKMLAVVGGDVIRDIFLPQNIPEDNNEMKKILLVVVLNLLAVGAAFAQGAMHVDGDKNGASAAASGKEMGLFFSSDMKWKTGPASLPAGAKLSVMEGDPSKEGFFTMRLWLPDGFKVPPHWHPKVEHVTVISGTFNLGMGEKFDKKATKAMPAGTFGFWQEGMRHFAWADGDTVIQLHGTGPWTITYVNPSDDPRNQKK